MTIEEHICTPADYNNHKNAKMNPLRNLLHNVPLPHLPTRKSFREGMTLRNVLGYPLQEAPDAVIRETAWLDGLRGLAAFLVMIYHFNLALWFPPAVEAPWGALDTYGFRQNGRTIIYKAIWRLPILRVPMTAGHSQVSVFFVLSGFVLSWGPLGNIRAGRSDKVMQSLGSAVFRRWIRLYLPCFAISLWEAFELYFGLRFIGNRDQKSNIFLQLWDWTKDSEKFANPFMIDRDKYSSLHGYDWTMWTIPYEFAGSLMVFLTLLATGRFRHHSKRTLVILGIVSYACIRAEWTYWLFATGMLLAGYVRSHGGFAKLNEKTTARGRMGYIAILIFGLLLAGVPEAGEFYDRPGYEWLMHLTPWNWREIEGGGRWLWCWSGILFIFAACHLPGVIRVFEFSFMRYLGRISYMLYLTHRITLNLLGERIKPFMFALFNRHQWIDAPTDGSDENWLITAALYFVLMGILIPVSLVVANWAEKLIDAPSTRLARSVDDWFLKGSTDEHHGMNGGILPSAHARQESTAEGIEMQSATATAPGRESISREEGTGLLTEQQVEEMREIDPRPLPDR